MRIHLPGPALDLVRGAVLDGEAQVWHRSEGREHLRETEEGLTGAVTQPSRKVCSVCDCVRLRLLLACARKGVRGKFGLHPVRYRKPRFDSYPVYSSIQYGQSMYTHLNICFCIVYNNSTLEKVCPATVRACHPV